jgi:Na+-driven multidrug efflux pump
VCGTAALRGSLAAQVAGHAVTFLRCRALACPALLALYVATGSLRGHQDTRTPLQAALIANAVNLALDIVLIFGLGLGVAGVRAGADVSRPGGC